jgi:uncharacterized protein (DUF1697 family)
MTKYVSLLRAVNVGGTGKLPMKDLTELCVSAGLLQVQTYIASGNVVFSSNRSETQVRTELENQLKNYAKKSVGVVVRTASEMTDVVERNPFPDAPGNQVAVLFLDAPLPSDPLDGVTGLKDEQIRLGKRELFIFYPSGMGTSRLRMPRDKVGTARNMNTVTKLAEMAADLT